MGSSQYNVAWPLLPGSVTSSLRISVPAFSPAAVAHGGGEVCWGMVRSIVGEWEEEVM